MNMPKATNTMLINKDTGNPIGFVTNLSVKFTIESILVAAEWQVYRPPLSTKYYNYKGIVVSIKWTEDMLTIEVSNVQEIRDETAQ